MKDAADLDEESGKENQQNVGSEDEFTTQR